LGIGDWGLGIGDWAQSPIPNPQSPLRKYNYIEIKNKFFKKMFNKIKKNNFKTINNNFCFILLKFKL